MQVIFSYDCEGNWGCVDWDNPYLTESYAEELKEAYQKICALHEKYAIPATFGFVGLYALEKEERQLFLQNNCKELTAEYPNMLLSGGCWEGAENLSTVNQNKELFSVASHSLTHIPFSRLSSEQIRREHTESKRILQEKTGQDVDSFIFPRNVIAQESLLPEFFNIYRETPANTKYLRIKDLMQTVLGVNLTKQDQISDFIFWKGGARKNFSDTGWKKLWTKRIKQSAKYQTIHTWSHPHNFVTDKSLFERLEWLMKMLTENNTDISTLTLSQLAKAS